MWLHPITNDYPVLTPYQFASNRPIDAIDIDGLESWELSSQANNLKRQEQYYDIQLNLLKYTPQPRRNVVGPTTHAQMERNTKYTEQVNTMNKMYNTDQGWSFRIFTGIGASATSFGEGLIVEK